MSCVCGGRVSNQNSGWGISDLRSPIDPSGLGFYGLSGELCCCQLAERAELRGSLTMPRLSARLCARKSAVLSHPRIRVDGMSRPRTFEEKRIATAVRLPESVHRRLHQAATDRDVSANLLVTRAVCAYLDRLPSANDILPVGGPSKRKASR